MNDLLTDQVIPHFRAERSWEYPYFDPHIYVHGNLMKKPFMRDCYGE